LDSNFRISIVELVDFLAGKWTEWFCSKNKVIKQ